MANFKKAICLVLCLILIFTLCACGEKESSAIISYGVTQVPKTIDPQKASSSVELMIVRNLFEGLLRENENGEIVNGVISDYQKNGLTYVFNVKQDAVWSDKRNLSANDFVFAFRRALLPETDAVHAKSLYCIKNAKQINEGSLSAESLGVYADSDKTLRIELEYADDEFLTTLTTAICMPCNEEFFVKSIGKYGMSAETILANGSYKMRKWNTQDFAMRIIKNTCYSGDFVPQNAAVYFSKNKDYNNFECLEKNYINIAALDFSNTKDAKNKGYSVLSLKNKAIVLSIGKGFDKEMRRALFTCTVDGSDFSEDSDDISVAKTVYPDILNIQNISEINAFDPNSAKELYFSEYKRLNLKEFPQKTIRYFGDEKTLEVAKRVAAHWQQYLGIYINVAPENSIESIKYAQQNDDYCIAVYSTEITQSNTDEYLSKIGAKRSGDLQSTQDRIINDYDNIPLAYGFSYYAYSSRIQNVKAFPTNGIFDFTHILKDE